MMMMAESSSLKKGMVNTISTRVGDLVCWNRIMHIDIFLIVGKYAHWSNGPTISFILFSLSIATVDREHKSFSSGLGTCGLDESSMKR